MIEDNGADIFGARGAFDLDDTDGAQHPDGGDIRERAERCESGLELLFDASNGGGVVGAGEQVERGDSGGTGKRVCHIGRAVHERAGEAVGDGLRDAVGGCRCGEGKMTAGEAL